jgi:taurine dioxygenase
MARSMQIIEQPGSCGALITGIDLTKVLSPATQSELREHWLKYQVVGFPEQQLSLGDLERFAETLGDYGEDPFFESIPDHPHIAEVRRAADETTPLFAESWHSDWSFLKTPPTATLLFSRIIPPIGGETLFANQYAAWETLEPSLKAELKDLEGIHSAARGYAPDGLYGEADEGRSMAIRYSSEAYKTQCHPIAKVHPETGRTALFVNPGYTLGIEGLGDEEAWPILLRLFEHQTQQDFIYRHQWSEDMLVVWDNRCVLHAATGGYDGYDRLLERITVTGVPRHAQAQ